MTRRAVLPVGCCRFCGCTPERPCTLANGDECAFISRRADRCNKPACVRAWQREWNKALEENDRRERMMRALRRKTNRNSTRRKAA